MHRSVSGEGEDIETLSHMALDEITTHTDGAITEP